MKKRIAILLMCVLVTTVATEGLAEKVSLMELKKEVREHLFPCFKKMVKTALISSGLSSKIASVIVEEEANTKEYQALYENWEAHIINEVWG